MLPTFQMPSNPEFRVGSPPQLFNVLVQICNLLIQSGGIFRGKYILPEEFPWSPCGENKIYLKPSSLGTNQNKLHQCLFWVNPHHIYPKSPKFLYISQVVLENCCTKIVQVAFRKVIPSLNKFSEFVTPQCHQDSV